MGLADPDSNRVKMLFRPAVCSLIFRLREYFLMAVRKALLPSGGGNTSALDRPRTGLSLGPVTRWIAQKAAHC
jgi:hypothetical protein